jgi:HSP20 family protein
MLSLLPFLALSPRIRETNPYLPISKPTLTRNTPSRNLRAPLSELFSPSSFFDDFMITPSYTSAKSFMALEVKESENGYDFSIDLPGIPKENIDICVEDHVLTVKGERKSSYEENKPMDEVEGTSEESTEAKEGENKVTYHRSEVFYGQVSRSFSLPENADEDKVDAKYENGVLTVHIEKQPKQEEQSKVKKIAVM